ncbi:MAG: class I SAM-dependent methyltransferase [Patescibacteria group bacterium]
MPTIEHAEGTIRITSSKNGTQTIAITPATPETFIRTASCTTTYPLELIQAIAKTKGASYICDEIRRDDDPYYIEHHIVTTLFSYVRPKDFEGKRLLDFGCGAGASTMIFARHLPKTSIVGVELLKEHLDIAQMRAEFYGYQNIQFLQSPSPKKLPAHIGEFDFIFLPAVYEHLLPEERKRLMSQLWSILKPNGILFIDETPHRWFPIETHTTGLPLINYLPSPLACAYARTCSKRNLKKDSWNTLLRKGIRGSTPRSILRTIRAQGGAPKLLKSINPDLKNPVDIWYEGYARHESDASGGMKRFMRSFLKTFFAITRVPLVPYISIAIKK